VDYADKDNGVGLILFAIVCFIISIVAFKIALVAGTIFCFAKGIIRLAEGHIIRFGLWFVAGGFLFWIQVVPNA